MTSPSPSDDIKTRVAGFNGTNSKPSSDASSIKRHDDLRKRLRKSQVKGLSKAAFRGTGIVDWSWQMAKDIAYYFFYWLPQTWWHALTSLPNLVVDPIGIWCTLTFAAGTSVILFFSLIASCLWKLPLVQNMWRPYSRMKDIGLGNMAYPQIFEFGMDPMNKRIKEAAFRVMSDPLAPSSNPSTDQVRIFDLEVSKMLMMLSALVYERDTAGFHEVAKVCAHSHKKHMDFETEKGDLTSLGQNISTKLDDADRKIRKVAAQWGLHYASISELATNTSPLCGAFWSHEHNFLVIAFKGTNPVEFKEWSIDMTISYTDGRSWLPGFSKVHSGFYSQIFPKNLNGATGLFPYTEIRTQIADIVKNIRQSTGKDHVNLYVTGHSLGAALACIFYSRALASPSDYGKNESGENQVMVRDAYCFGTPIVGTSDCISAFNGISNRQNFDHPTNLWRVTNSRDAVATLLPEGGDYDMFRNISPGSQLHFSHIGQEIQLTNNETKVYQGPGTFLAVNTPVTIVSHLDKGGVGPKVMLSDFYKLLEYMPFLRRFVVHMPSYYWSRLSKVQAEHNVEYCSRH